VFIDLSTKWEIKLKEYGGEVDHIHFKNNIQKEEKR
jgi:hypothetical protein